MILKIFSKTLGTFDVLVDDDIDQNILNMKWVIVRQRGNKFRVAISKYKSKNLFLHREIMKVSDNLIVDHINGNPLDNRKCNLRICNNSENTRNRDKSKNNTSGYKGVCFVKNKKQKQWVSKIKYNYKSITLGYFHTKEEAAKVYNKAAIKYFGEFAKLNEIKE